MFQTVAVIVLFGVGLVLGRWCGRSQIWWVGFTGSLLIVGTVMLGHRSMGLSVVVPFSWVISPDVGPLLMALVVPVMLSVLIVRLRERRKRAVVNAAMIFMFAFYSLVPVIMPLAVRGSLLAGRTVIDSHGVCLQSHGYTCGPASAVTCLKWLGVAGEEGEIAVSARSGPAVGTDPILMRDALNKLYGSAGVSCDYRIVRDLDELKTPFIATMWIPHVGGHYVAVLEVSREFVIVGDPISGHGKWDRREFEQDWKGAAHEISWHRSK